MTQNISLVLFTVNDAEASKKLYSTYLGTEPYVAHAYYVGFKTGNVEVGLTPGVVTKSTTPPVIYIDVPDIKATLQTLLDAGAQIDQEPKDVGGGMLVGTIKDADGNILGLRQPAN